MKQADERRERNFEIIRQELPHALDKREEPIILRVIAETADMDFAHLLMFHEDPIRAIKTAVLYGANVATDSEVAYAAIDRDRLSQFGGSCHFFAADEDVVNEAVRRGLTPAAVAVRKAAKMHKPFIYVVTESPEAVHEICRIERTGHLDAPAVIAMPPGFVDIDEAREEILQTGIPVIASAGSKGGSLVGAAVLNAILEEL